MTDQRSWEAMAVVGRVARPHGLRGQVVVNPETDFPEDRFGVGATLFIRRGDRTEPITVATSRIQQGRPVIGLEGVTDMNAAQALAGLEFRVPVDALAALPQGTFYHHDLVGCVVTTLEGMTVGTVSAVEGTEGSSRLVVQSDRGEEVLVPLATDICTQIEPAAKRIVIQPPEGLLELNIRRR
jgi:16S rRNA processing protein RimM